MRRGGHMNHISRRDSQGFTLMEIMVVIIVIAVLASVAGPMITSITDQGRASATKSKLSALKSAIMAYNSDIGRYPYAGTSDNSDISAAYDSNLSPLNTSLFADSFDNNILTTASSGTDISANSVFGIANYINKKWKGPYMDSDPTDFMYDSWGKKIQYYHYNKGIYLHSAGSDQSFDSRGDVTKPAYEGDDIILSIARVKF